MQQELYIENTDFQEVAEKGYRRLTPNQPVGLRYTGLVLEFSDLKKVNYTVLDSSMQFLVLNTFKFHKTFVF